MDVDHDGTLVGPGGGGGIIHDAGAIVIGAVGQLPVGDALSLQGEHDAVGGIIVGGDIGVAPDIGVLGAVSSCRGGRGDPDAQILKGLELTSAELAVHRLLPQPAGVILALTVGQAGGGALSLAGVAQLQLQARAALVTHAGGVGLVLAGIFLAVVDDAVHIAVPGAGGIDAEHVALTGAFLLIPSVDQLVVGGGCRAVVNRQGHSLALDRDTSDLDPTVVGGQGAPVLQDVAVGGDAADIDTRLIGDLHLHHTGAVHGLVGIGLNALDVRHSQVGAGGERSGAGSAVPGQTQSEKLSQIGQGHIAHLTGQIGGGVHSHAASFLGPVPESQAGLSLYKGDLPFLLLIGQPQLGADAHGDLGPVLPVDIGGRFQLQCRPVQRDRYRRVDSLDGQAQGEQHGQRQHQRQEPFRYGSHKSMTSSFQDLLIG